LCWWSLGLLGSGEKFGVNFARLVHARTVLVFLVFKEVLTNGLAASNSLESRSGGTAAPRDWVHAKALTRHEDVIFAAFSLRRPHRSLPRVIHRLVTAVDFSRNLVLLVVVGLTKLSTLSCALVRTRIISRSLLQARHNWWVGLMRRRRSAITPLSTVTARRELKLPKTGVI